MKKILGSLLFLIFFASGLSHAASPVGYWKTIDDQTGRVQSILKISLYQNTLYGKIVKIFPEPGRTVNEVCKACTDYRRNKPIVGMVIMQGLKQNKAAPNEWGDGEILDARNGKIYNCSIRVIANGQKLNVRGYIGLPLLGRTQTWLRVSGPQG